MTINERITQSLKLIEENNLFDNLLSFSTKIDYVEASGEKDNEIIIYWIYNDCRIVRK